MLKVNRTHYQEGKKSNVRFLRAPYILPLSILVPFLEGGEVLCTVASMPLASDAVLPLRTWFDFVMKPNRLLFFD